MRLAHSPFRLDVRCVSLAFCALLLATACGADDSGEGANESAVHLQQQVQEVVIPNPDGVYFANIVANGTGCPRGTWDVNIDPEGETFTLTFSAYQTGVEPGKVIGVKDCQIGVKLHSPQGLSYAVSKFYYAGYLFLDQQGMTATQTAGYYFQGNPADSLSARTDLSGPFDDAYLFEDDIPLPNLVWSPCGTDRQLNIPTRIITKNNPAKTGTGYFNTLAVDGSVQLAFSLKWRDC